MIEAGQVVFVKTTSEPVFVVSIDKTQEPEPFQFMAKVRRPKMGESGIVHTTDFFYAEELETLQEQKDRIRAEYKQAGFGGIAQQGLTEAKAQVIEIPTIETVN